MGCDIHVFREKKIGGVWVTTDTWSDKYNEGYLSVAYDDQGYTGRNYQLFGVLAGVRKQTSVSVPPRGIPDDMCQLVRDEWERWGCDAHTPSWLTLAELKMLDHYLKTGQLLPLLSGEGGQTLLPGKSLAILGSEHGVVMSPLRGMMERGQLERLKEGMAKPVPDYTELYPYCLGTNQPNYVSFDIEVPLGYVMGDDLGRLISCLDDLPGEDEDRRIVFWFDN